MYATSRTEKPYTVPYNLNLLKVRSTVNIKMKESKQGVLLNTFMKYDIKAKEQHCPKYIVMELLSVLNFMDCCDHAAEGKLILNTQKTGLNRER